MQKVAVAVALILAACGDNETPPPERPVPPSPTQGVDNAQLAQLLVQQWDLEADVDPLTATFYGERRVAARLPPITRAEVAALRVRRHALLDEVTAFDASALSERDRVTYGVLAERLAVAAGLEVCDYERWTISARTGVYGRLDALGDYHPLYDAEDAAGYLARVQAMPAAIDAYGAELVASAEDGVTAQRDVVNGAFGTLEVWAARPPETWPIVVAASGSFLADDDARDALAAQVKAIVTSELAPAYLRLANTIRTRVLPGARSVEGLVGLPAGRDCYAAEIRRHTSLPLTAAELHARGEAEVARIEGEMIALGQQLYGVGTLPALAERLFDDPAQHFASEDELISWTQMIIDRAIERTQPLFVRFPAIPLELTPYPRSAGAIAASYGQSPDGIQPAHYYFVSQPVGGQVRWNAESTTYHEAVPGHHLQIGRAMELTDLPAIRRLFDDTAFIEGWGLYAEGLADEIGLYLDDAARVGRLSNEALRACRLVIDTGLHDLGWTRAEAIAYMQAHTLYGGDFIQTEITRYLNTPGQALAYKVGERELLQLRAAQQARAGAAFALRDFHEAVLSEGSMPLPVLAARLDPASVGQAASPRRAAPDRTLARTPDRTSWRLAQRPPPPALESGFRAPSPD